MKVIDDSRAVVIILAGYLRILSPEFIEKYNWENSQHTPFTIT